METVRDQSFGVVPILKKDEEWQVLLVNQISYRGSNDRFWTFPKGHPEANESELDTAKRELLEETSVKDVRIIEEAKFPITYTFRHEDKQIEKTVTYYLGVCNNSDLKITLPEEIADLGWFSIKGAMEKLTHKNAQKVLIQAGQYINEHSDSL